MKSLCTILLAVWFTLTACRSFADEIRVATASNFRDAMYELASRFEAESIHRVIPIFGSTGKLYAQVVNGAPFDAFFAADTERPLRLESENLAVAGSRFTYALGKLVLWSPVKDYVDASGRVLENEDFRHLAMANPAHAPYGKAAREVLETRGLWPELEERLVLGENVGQAFLYVSSGNAELGFVAWSQLKRSEPAVTGSYWLVPGESYQPIRQQAVLLDDNEASRAFMSFVRSPNGIGIIRAHGYDIAD